jgi:hypothetical protein
MPSSSEAVLARRTPTTDSGEFNMRPVSFEFSSAAPARRALRGTLSAWTLAALAACGGGSGDNAVIAPALISGTAAAGAPVVGQVTIKDSTGRSVTHRIEANGQYTVDVTGMQGPFVLMAEGTVGGRSVSLVSAATADDVNQTINITPFTDLIVANIAGAAAASYFNAPDFSKLSKLELDDARQALTAKLLPILRNLEVADGFDLLRSSFKADHSGFDAVMDVLRVSTDAAARTAAITNLVDNSRIVDDLASRSDADSFVEPSVALGDTVAALKAIESALAAFSAEFKNGVPASNNAALRALMSSDFRDWGGGVDGFLSNDGVLASWLVGAVQSGATITAISENGAAIDVEFETRLASGTADLWKQQFRRNAAGQWQYAGNRRWLTADMRAVNARFQHSDRVSWVYQPNLGFWTTTRHPTAPYVLLSGPGLTSWSPPELTALGLNGVVLERGGAAFRGRNDSGLPLSSWLPDCSHQGHSEINCTNLAAVSAGGTYTFTLLDANGAPIGAPEQAVLAERPLTAAQAEVAGHSRFPRIAAIQPSTLGGLQDGVVVSMSLIAPTAGSSSFYQAAIKSPTNTVYVRDFVGSTVTLGVWNGVSPTDPVEFNIATRNPAGSEYISFVDMY